MTLPKYLNKLNWVEFGFSKIFFEFLNNENFENFVTLKIIHYRVYILYYGLYVVTNQKWA